MADDSTHPSAKTRAAEAEEARAAHMADRPPTAREDAAAEGQGLDPAVAHNYKQATRRGAAQEGEGRIP